MPKFGMCDHIEGTPVEQQWRVIHVLEIVKPDYGDPYVKYCDYGYKCCVNCRDSIMGKVTGCFLEQLVGKEAEIIWCNIGDHYLLAWNQHAIPEKEAAAIDELVDLLKGGSDASSD